MRHAARRAGLACCLAAASGLALPGGARAAEGMPQLNFANPLTTSQVVWMVLIFIGLYYVLSRYALPQVGAVLAERAAKIGADIEAARQAKAQADHAVRELIESTARARTEAQAQIKTAVEDAKGRAEAETALANARLETQLQAAEQRIEAARTAAMTALRDVATETATALLSRLTGRPPDPRSLGAAVDQVLAARGHS